METPRDRDDRLAEDLRALRPTPHPQFAAELDERVAAGFPRRSRLRLPSLNRMHAIRLRRLLIPAGGIAVLAIAVTTAVIATNDGEKESTGGGSLLSLTAPASEESAPAPEVGASEASAATSEAGAPLNFGGNSRSSAGATNLDNRAVERSAELVLAAAPGDVGEDSSKVFEAVHAHDGIVMSSSTREGKPGEAAARFELLIPSAKLGDALAALSAIDEVRSRHEATDDITAPTVATGELL